MTSIQKPFLKWIGGKTQIIDKIIDKIPTEMNNYHEIFVGGGSVLLAVLSLQKQGKITIKKDVIVSDINGSLINVYKHIQNNKDELFKYVMKYRKEYDEITGTEVNRKASTKQEAKTSKESYYYWMRKRFNEMDKSLVKCSAIFVFLNKTCFRGMYRVGPNGFNVPYGNYKTTPTIITEKEIDNISELIKDVKFYCLDFSESMKKIKNGDFVYLDPPYAPEKKTSFVGYADKGFGITMHEKLFEMIIKLKKNRKKFLMSNSNVELVVDAFQDYEIDEIVAKRAINSKNPNSTTIEVLITNY
jgi:DNA adenine methylase